MFSILRFSFSPLLFAVIKFIKLVLLLEVISTLSIILFFICQKQRMALKTEYPLFVFLSLSVLNTGIKNSLYKYTFRVIRQYRHINTTLSTRRRGKEETKYEIRHRCATDHHFDRTDRLVVHKHMRRTVVFNSKRFQSCADRTLEHSRKLYKSRSDKFL